MQNNFIVETEKKSLQKNKTHKYYEQELQICTKL